VAISWFIFCHLGNRPSATVQPYLLLHLDIYPNTVHTIKDALRLFSASETLEGYRISPAAKVFSPFIYMLTMILMEDIALETLLYSILCVELYVLWVWILGFFLLLTFSTLYLFKLQTIFYSFFYPISSVIFGVNTTIYLHICIHNVTLTHRCKTWNINCFQNSKTQAV